MRTLGRILAVGLLCASSGSASADTPFGANSIIIPATATYQTDCGAVSVYGFVYNILRANAYLETNKVGLGINGTIEVHYAFKDTKSSPNRCTPTNLHNGPPYPGVPAPLHNDVKWNDGCDFEVFSAGLVPVKQIVNTTATNVLTDLAVFSSINTTDATHTSTSGGEATFPNWINKSIQHTGVPLTNVDTVRYWGGVFIINDLDAPTLRRLIQGTLIAQDSSGANIDFSGYKTSACTYGTTIGGQLNFHVAQAAFTAPTPKILTAKPPRLALLGRNANQNPFDGTAFFFCGGGVGGANCRGVNSKTGRVADTILENYLERAGLIFPGANGCAIGGYLATTFPCPGATCVCPSPNATGQIYDLLDFRDIMGAGAANKLAATVAGLPLYKMFWAPHWEFIGAGANADEQQALSNIASFADGQAGVMAECASIAAFEGATGSPTMNSQSTSQFQTCTNGACATIAQGFDTNTGGIASAGPFGNNALRNCTDPNLANGSACAYFAAPGDPFIQIGDFKFNALQGVPSTVADFKPNAGAQYRPGVSTLVSGVATLDNTKLATPAIARTMAGFKGDFVSRNFKDNNAAKSNVLYLGLHDETSSIAGTKIALQTLLLLGDAPVTPVNREVTRSSPILATINGESLIVQGTFEQITPAPTTKTANNDGEVATFEFPFLLGHMRGIRANQISTLGVQFNALGVPAAAPAPVAFDAASGIPAVTFGGCGGAAFGGACRTVFTNATRGQGPARITVRTGSAVLEIERDAGAPLLSLRDAIGSGLLVANQDIVIERVLKGSPGAVPGTFTSKLGGIDHSTVAVIDPSIVAGSSARPQMIYVGSTDGMMHAFCATVAPTFGCDIVGRELWAFIPRVNLKKLRKNTARIDGSARVLDLFGDFNPSDTATNRTFKTVLLFQTGSGDPALVDETPAVYALDVTTPNNPTILWEYAVLPASRGASEFGQGTFLTAGTVRIGGVNKLVAFAHTNNGGTTAKAGSVVSALNIETPGPIGAAVTRIWKATPVNPESAPATNPLNFYPDPTRSGLTGPTAVPMAGVPGGAIAVDKGQTGAITDVVLGNLYGEIWQLNAADGSSRYTGSKPLFRFGQDRKPFGAPPALFSQGGVLFAALTSGGYFDPFALGQWSDPQQHLIIVSLSTLDADATVTEASAQPVPLKRRLDLTPGDKGFSQVIVVGDQLFFTTDTTDVNAAAFGTGGNTGKLHQVGTGGGAETTVVISGGAGSIAYNGGTGEAFAGSSDSLKRLAPPGALPGAGESTKQIAKKKIERRLWLQTL